MIHCKLHGRIGNNLFSIATGLAQAKKLNTDLTIATSAIAGHYGNLPVDLSWLKYNFVQTDDIDFNTTYNEKEMHYDEICIQDNTILNGIFGSWKYFETIKDEICNKYFLPAEKIIDKLNKYTVSDNSLGISVRRGDFLNLQHHHCVLSIDYYQDVLNEYFQNNIDSIYIFSDDIKWCKSIFGKEVYYVEDIPEVQLFLMTKMKHFVMSNSTFAWWGAYLNQNNGVIIAPDPWLGPAYDTSNTNDIYYPTWIRKKHNRILQTI